MIWNQLFEDSSRGRFCLPISSLEVDPPYVANIYLFSAQQASIASLRKTCLFDLTCNLSESIINVDQDVWHD